MECFTSKWYNQINIGGLIMERHIELWKEEHAESYRGRTDYRW